MSEMHAETALWIDGLRRRADKAQTAMRDCPADHVDTVAARDRLSRFHSELDAAGKNAGHAHGKRTDLETMADEIDAAIARVLARI